jgi:hypothetical protein
VRRCEVFFLLGTIAGPRPVHINHQRMSSSVGPIIYSTIVSSYVRHPGIWSMLGARHFNPPVFKKTGPRLSVILKNKPMASKKRLRKKTTIREGA